MAPRDASRVQLDFPELVADLIRQLRLTGTLGLLELSDQVTPVYIVAQRAGALSVTLSPPVFASPDIFEGVELNPASNTIVFDTGALPAGDYDVFGQMSLAGRAASIQSNIVLEHRDAANALNIAILLTLPYTTTAFFHNISLDVIRYTLALNERIRMRVGQAITGVASGGLSISIVPTP